MLRAGVVPLLGPAVPLLEALPLVRLAAPFVAPLSACNDIKFSNDGRKPLDLVTIQTHYNL